MFELNSGCNYPTLSITPKIYSPKYFNPQNTTTSNYLITNKISRKSSEFTSRYSPVIKHKFKLRGSLTAIRNNRHVFNNVLNSCKRYFKKYPFTVNLSAVKIRNTQTLRFTQNKKELQFTTNFLTKQKVSRNLSHTTHPYFIEFEENLLSSKWVFMGPALHNSRIYTNRDKNYGHNAYHKGRVKYTPINRKIYFKLHKTFKFFNSENTTSLIDILLDAEKEDSCVKLNKLNEFDDSDSDSELSYKHSFKNHKIRINDIRSSKMNTWLHPNHREERIWTSFFLFLKNKSGRSYRKSYTTLSLLDSTKVQISNRVSNKRLKKSPDLKFSKPRILRLKSLRNGLGEIHSYKRLRRRNRRQRARAVVNTLVVARLLDSYTNSTVKKFYINNRLRLKKLKYQKKDKKYPLKPAQLLKSDLLIIKKREMCRKLQKLLQLEYKKTNYLSMRGLVLVQLLSVKSYLKTRNYQILLDTLINHNTLIWEKTSFAPYKVLQFKTQFKDYFFRRYRNTKAQQRTPKLVKNKKNFIGVKNEDLFHARLRTYTSKRLLPNKLRRLKSRRLVNVKKKFIKTVVKEKTSARTPEQRRKVGRKGGRKNLINIIRASTGRVFSRRMRRKGVKITTPDTSFRNRINLVIRGKKDPGIQDTRVNKTEPKRIKFKLIPVPQDRSTTIELRNARNTLKKVSEIIKYRTARTAFYKRKELRLPKSTLRDNLKTIRLLRKARNVVLSTRGVSKTYKLRKDSKALNSTNVSVTTDNSSSKPSDDAKNRTNTLTTPKLTKAETIETTMDMKEVLKTSALLKQAQDRARRRRERAGTKEPDIAKVLASIEAAKVRMEAQAKEGKRNYELAWLKKIPTTVSAPKVVNVKRSEPSEFIKEAMKTSPLFKKAREKKRKLEEQEKRKLRLQKLAQFAAIKPHRLKRLVLLQKQLNVKPVSRYKKNIKLSKVLSLRLKRRRLRKKSYLLNIRFNKVSKLNTVNLTIPHLRARKNWKLYLKLIYASRLKRGRNLTTSLKSFKRHMYATHFRKKINTEPTSIINIIFGNSLVHKTYKQLPFSRFNQNYTPKFYKRLWALKKGIMLYQILKLKRLASLSILLNKLYINSWVTYKTKYAYESGVRKLEAMRLEDGYLAKTKKLYFMSYNRSVLSPESASNFFNTFYTKPTHIRIPKSGHGSKNKGYTRLRPKPHLVFMWFRNIINYFPPVALNKNLAKDVHWRVILQKSHLGVFAPTTFNYWSTFKGLSRGVLTKLNLAPNGISSDVRFVPRRLAFTTMTYTNFVLSNYGFYYKQTWNSKITNRAQIRIIRQAKYSFANPFTYKKSILKRLTRRKSYSINSSVLENLYTTPGFNLFNIHNTSLFRHEGGGGTLESNEINLSNQLFNGHMIVDDAASARPHRIRFKPGYSTMWRRARRDFKEAYFYKFRYQHRLTKLVQKLDFSKVVQNSWASISNSSNLFVILMKSKFATDPFWSRELLDNNSVFINGFVVTNPHASISCGDFLQLVIHVKYYMVMKWQKNLTILKKSRVFRFFSRKFRPKTSSMWSNRNYRYPDWILNLRFFDSDVPSYVELDFFTLSLFVLHNPFQGTNWGNFKDLYLYPLVLRLYNWKFI